LAVRQILANKGNEILWDVVKLHNFEVVICLYDLTVEKGLEYAARHMTWESGVVEPRGCPEVWLYSFVPSASHYQNCTKIMYVQTIAWCETCIYL